MRRIAKSCSKTLREIENHFNEAKELSLIANAHLKECKDCQSYADTIEAFRATACDVYAKLDEKKAIGLSRYPEQKIVNQKRGILLVAAVLFCMAIAFLVLPQTKSAQHPLEQYTKIDTDNFVEGIFSSPILDHRIDTGVIWESGWFDDSSDFLL